MGRIFVRALRCNPAIAVRVERGRTTMGTTIAEYDGPTLHRFSNAMFTSSSTRDAAHSGGTGALGQIASLAALAALMGASWHTLRSTHQRRLAERPSAKPEREQVWEGEGGQNQMPESPPP
jgi:hypothetical protein